MTTSLKNFTRIVLIVVLTVPLGGCLMRFLFWSGVLNKLPEGEVQVTAESVTHDCSTTSAPPGGVTIDCSHSAGGEIRTSRAFFDPTGAAESRLIGRIVDPVILQLPADAHDFAGSYSHSAGATGRLSIISGLASIPVDSSVNLRAEPGMQLLIVDFPDPSSAPTGDYRFTFGFKVTPRTTPVPVKTIFAARATANGRRFFLPLLPCAGSLEEVPAISLGDSPGQTFLAVATELARQSGCAGKRYVLEPGAPYAPAVIEAVEYYNPALDHYFLTWRPDEIAALDAGTRIRGWSRTGQSFRVHTNARTGTSPVCRFYIPPALGDSHFFGRGTQECAETGSRHPTFVNEDPAFMYVGLPVNGSCPSGTRAVYRVFSNRTDANHRYLVDSALRNQMVSRGWLAEGDGPDRIVMCAAG